MLKPSTYGGNIMAEVNQLEKKLDEVFVKNAPFQLPKNVKEWIVKYLPYINLFFGIVTLWAAWALYESAKILDQWADVANSLAKTYGVSGYDKTGLTAFVWVSILVLLVEAVLWISAFPGTRDKKKSGWNLLFYALMVNVVYGVVVVFTDYGGPSRLFGVLISTVIGLYFLFQIREMYLGKSSSAKDSDAKTPKKPTAKS